MGPGCPAAAILRVTVQIVCTLALAYPLLHVYVVVDLRPYRRGFYCDDESIKKPNVAEEISVGACVAVWAGIVAVVLPVVETLLHFAVFEEEKRAEASRGCCGKLSLVTGLLVKLYRILGRFVLGALCTLLTTELAKFKVGRLRPYFLSVCNPDLSDQLCRDERGYYKYVTEYTCRGAADDEVQEASKSFLSGHSSFSAYCATFLILYLNSRLKTSTTSDQPKKSSCGLRATNAILAVLAALRPFLQFGLFCLAFYIMLTRISDYK